MTTVHGRYQSSVLTADSRTHTPVDDKLTNVAIVAVSCNLHGTPKPGSDDTTSIPWAMQFPGRLTVNLRECYCNSGCCDMQMTAIECFSRGFATVPPREVKLEGLIRFDETMELAIADDFAREPFELWTSKRTGCAVSAPNERILLDGDAGFKEEVQLELERNGNW